MLAARSRRENDWTSEDLQAARLQANEMSRGERHTNQTPSERWYESPPLTKQGRTEFQFELDKQRQKVHNQDSEALNEAKAGRREAARKERHAITQALVELEYLSVTWRSIPLPFNAHKVANIR